MYERLKRLKRVILIDKTKIHSNEDALQAIIGVENNA